MGILIQLAAQQATNGTILPTKGGSFFTIAFKLKAVPNAPPVAHTYEVPRHKCVNVNQICTCKKHMFAYYEVKLAIDGAYDRYLPMVQVLIGVSPLRFVKLTNALKL